MANIVDSDGARTPSDAARRGALGLGVFARRRRDRRSADAAAVPTPAAGALPTAGAAESADFAEGRGARGSVWRRWFAPLDWIRAQRVFSLPTVAARIVALNLVVSILLVAAVFTLNQSRASLIDVRLKSLTTEAELIAISIAERAHLPNLPFFDGLEAKEVLRRLALPTGVRAQLYDRGGRLIADTRSLFGAEHTVEKRQLDPPDVTSALFRRLEEIADRLGVLSHSNLELYSETRAAFITDDPIVDSARSGVPASAQRINSEQELILSVAVPIKLVKTVLGALVLSTEGGEIDDIVADDRQRLAYFFGSALLASLFASIWLASTIARPLKRLASAAETLADVRRGPFDPNAIPIPPFSERVDEIANLAGALRRMTTALYSRIGAIESFAADVAHEIKNPLASMRSAVEMLGAARTPEQRDEILRVIEKDVGRIDRLITDISNASRLDARLVRQTRAPFDLRGLLETVVEISQPQAAKRGIRIESNLPADRDGLVVSGIEDALAQVFLNLVDNALSFARAGDVVTISAARSRIGASPAVLVEVADEGPGIPPDNLESIFERFYSNRPETEDFGNHSGLGLSICRQIVDTHGGWIRAENRTDRSGALFLVAIPA